ncbi:hypothetical protein [Xanthomonas sp. NCPPB 2632]|uniref:hypothetical protein n=1 Tax=Xanthomonas sp. NCPPB 2632 TaxID=3240912 RepID=UPI003510F2EC
MRELKQSELRYVAGGLQKGPIDGGTEPPVIVTGPGGGGGGVSPPPGGGTIGGSPSTPHGGGGASGGGSGLPAGYDSIGGFASPYANVTWGANQQISGANFGFSIGSDKIGAAMSQQAAGVTNTYTMTGGEQVSAALNWANGNYSESISGSGAYGALHFGFDVNSNSPDHIQLSYSPVAGSSIGISLDSSGATSETASTTLYDNGSIHVTAGFVRGTGDTEKYVKFEDSAHPGQHFEINLSHSTKSGWNAGIGIGYPY